MQTLKTVKFLSPEMNQNDKETICHPITTSEAYFLLEPNSGRFKNVRSESYQIFRKTLEYTETFGRIKDKTVADDLRTTLTGCGYTWIFASHD